MSVKNQLITWVQQQQANADASFEQYPKHQCILPNDAIYLLRWSSLNEFCGLIEEMCEGSGKPVSFVLRQAIAPEKEAIKRAYPRIGLAIDAILEHFGGGDENP